MTVENDAYKKLNMQHKHQFFTSEESQRILDQCPATTTVQRMQSLFNDIFSRQTAPMLMVSTILQAIQNKLDSPALFELKPHTIELITIIMKAARFNKASAKSITTENAHQGCFATNQLFHHYREILKLVMTFNNASKDMQIQLKFTSFPLEGLYMATLRLVTTSTKIIVDSQQEALNKSLHYLSTKRSGPENGRATQRSNNGSKRGRR